MSQSGHGAAPPLQPDARERYAHFVALTTRWMDNDAYRHVNNVVYYSFFDTAVNQYMLEQGVLDLESSPTVSLVVDTACSFFSPLSFPDIVHCGLRVVHLGTSSVRYEIGIFRNDEPLAAARGHLVHVCCERRTLQPVPMPARLRGVLERLRSLLA
ncbi:MAG: acyl-CoA thioesterase [Burkholderiales bacterium]|nr:acyl-CoA thioesterase [Burkholderiales bacterium]